MKFGSDVPYTKTAKNVWEAIKAQLYISPQEGRGPPCGLPIGCKIKVPKHTHIIYQSIANFMYFQKNIRTINSKRPSGQHGHLGSCEGMKYEVFHTGSSFL